MPSDWAAVGIRNREISFNINSTPLQVQTDSEIGSEDQMWIQFFDSHLEGFTGIAIWFETPRYRIGHCQSGTIPSSKLGTDIRRIWTIKKEDTRLMLSCNGMQIFDFDIQMLKSGCEERRSYDFDVMRFTDGTKVEAPANWIDTASDFYRQFTDGKHETFVTPSPTILNFDYRCYNVR